VKPKSWCNYGAWVIWVMPLSTAIIFGVTLFLIYSTYAAYMEDFGGRNARKVAVVGLLFLAAFIGGYYSLGAYQLFFIELRRLFIVWRIVLAGDRFRVWGYMYKKDTFCKDQIVDLKEFKVKPKVWTSILTALTWEKGTNYRIILDDGREYYLSSHIWEFEELKALLEEMIEENRRRRGA